MVLDFEPDIVIAIIIGITICVVVKYGLSFYIKLKMLNEKNNFNELFAKHLSRMPGSDFDIDKENAEKQK